MKHILLCLFALITFTAPLTAQDAPKSLLPEFGKEGREFKAKSASQALISGWLPIGWDDNSAWAQLGASYTKLADGPKEGVTAVRVKLENASEGQLQITSYSGKRTFKKGQKYAVEGWLRSSGNPEFRVGIRQPGEPYEFYFEQDLSAGKEWKAFKFEFTPDADREALVMFVMPSAGTVDLAGVVVREAK